ncbi:VOC family protein [Serinicoccus kebangsaanensis]|uniref:VOC family protein n=1 Tax=Serinicoccus kebangsaanensis TaxID=2602069 RepID=UPI00124D50F1|nr:VOC family protein [Serinicoccus kebangsaanensis]
MTTTSPLRGIATLSYFADDVAQARDWYAELLGVESYFAMPEPPEPPQYVEFRIGDDQTELGIVDRRFAGPKGTEGGVVAYWAVDDLEAVWSRLLELGATAYEEPTPRGEGFVTAAVADPFGNILGIMANPHYREQRASRSS